jgi:hypothetical protein
MRPGRRSETAPLDLALLRGCEISLPHDHVAVSRIDDVLGLNILVSSDDEERVLVPIDPAELLELEPDRPDARRIGTLADQVEIRELSLKTLGQIQDLLVHRPKEQLIARSTTVALFLTPSHRPAFHRRRRARSAGERCCGDERSRPGHGQRNTDHRSFGRVESDALEERAEIQAIESLGAGSAEEAAAAVARLLAVTQATYERRAQLEHALQSRVAIEQAKGIVAERYGLDLEEAFELIRRAARTNRMKLHDLVRSIRPGEETPAELAALVGESARRDGHV